MTKARSILVALVAALPGMLGCNALTGADGLVIDERGRTESKDDDPPGGAASQGGVGGGTSGVGTGAGSTGSDTTAATAPSDPLGDANGVILQEIAIYQGVKRPLMEGGVATSSSIPIVAGRDALVRVFVATDGGYDGGAVTALLYVNDAPPLEVVVGGIGGTSSNGNLGSTINFDVPGSMLGGGFSYRVELKQPNTGVVNGAAHFPGSGFESAPVQSAGQVLKIRLVPIAYQADGSDRLPDTSASQLDRYRELFYAMYPVPAVEVSVRGAVGWANTVSPNGAGWDTLLSAVSDLRSDDGTPSDVYYYGIFSPASSLGAFCGNGCVSGLGFVGGPGDAYTRAAIGLGFPGASSIETAVHEIGHTHGREHAPCGGASGTDGAFPYGDGSIGVWGYNLITRDLYSPNNTADLMSYCSPAWVSDYNYKAIFDRIASVNNASMIYPPEVLDRTYDRVRIGADGELSWLTPITLHTPPFGEPIPVKLARDAGDEIVTAQRYRYDHLEGGVIVWPQGAAPPSSIQVELAGQLKSLAH